MRVAVAGAAGRMGQTVCRAIEEAEGLELTGRADPALDTEVGQVLGDADVLVVFTTPDAVVPSGREGVGAGVHCVGGSPGWAVGEGEGIGPPPPANVFFAPSFAVGAVLMMRFAAEASRHMPKAEIVEL